MKGKIFNAQEVQAMLNGSKVMFREVIKPRLFDRTEISKKLVRFEDETGYRTLEKNHKTIRSVIERCPYQVGQKIFCKEKFSIIKNIDFNYPPHDWRRDGQYIYEADAARSVGMYGCVKWKPAQHMKQEHSRLTLRIKSVKVERLADISEEDAVKEGFKAEHWLINTPDCYEYDGITAVQDFAGWWDETHKKPEEKFEANPFVWKIQFEVVK